MMFRFTIRDLLWLMVVVGLAISFYQQRIKIAQLHARLQRQEAALRHQDFRYGRLVETAAKQDIALRRMQAAQTHAASDRQSD
jgi:hypothetical protein